MCDRPVLLQVAFRTVAMRGLAPPSCPLICLQIGDNPVFSQIYKDMYQDIVSQGSVDYNFALDLVPDGESKPKAAASSGPMFPAQNQVFEPTPVCDKDLASANQMCLGECLLPPSSCVNSLLVQHRG